MHDDPTTIPTCPQYQSKTGDQPLNDPKTQSQIVGQSNVNQEHVETDRPTTEDTGGGPYVQQPEELTGDNGCNDPDPDIYQDNCDVTKTLRGCPLSDDDAKQTLEEMCGALTDCDKCKPTNCDHTNPCYLYGNMPQDNCKFCPGWDPDDAETLSSFYALAPK